MTTSYRRDVAWQASGNALAQAVGVLGIPILTRLYTPQDFAVQALFIQLVTFGTAIVTLRFEYFVQLPRARGDVRALNRLVLFLGFIAAAALSPVMWLYREPIAMLMGNEVLAQWIVFVPITAVMVSWAVATQNNAQRFGDFRLSGLSELGGKLLYVATGIAGGLTQVGVAGLIATTAFGAIGKAGFIIARQPPWGRNAILAGLPRVRHISVRYHRQAGYTVLAHLITTSAIAAPQVAIARLYGADVLGQFALVLTTIYLPSILLGGAIGQVYYQRAALIHARGESFFELWRATASKLVLMGAPVYGIAAILSTLAYPLFFGDQWALAGNLAMWMSIAAYGSFISGPLDRTCLIVRAGVYSVVWSIFRVVSTLLVIWFASNMELDPVGFVIALVIQMCIAYSIDFWMGYRFSKGQIGIFGSQLEKNQ